MRKLNIPQMIIRNAKTHALRRCVTVLLMTMLLTACAATQTVEMDISARAQARWDAVLAADWDTAYSFYSPGYRSSVSRTDFEIAQRLRSVKWINAEVLESSCEADVCTASVRAGYQVTRPVPGLDKWQNDRKVSERWVRTEGQWWYIPPE